jgi:AbrB family looped-hinge helix DNA binding protein
VEFRFARIASGGRVTLPKEVRDALGLAAGDYVSFEAAEDGAFVIRVGQNVSAVFGMIPYDGPPISVEQIRAGSRAAFVS